MIGSSIHRVDVVDSTTEQQTLRDVETALIEYLWPLAPGGARGEGWPMGVDVQANELQTQVARVAGVKAVKAIALFQKTDKGWQRIARDQPLPITAYQLPELLGVSASTANGEPGVPGGLEPLPKGSRVVPAPVVPQLC